jgi:hypothetical protein
VKRPSRGPTVAAFLVLLGLIPTRAAATCPPPARGWIVGAEAGATWYDVVGGLQGVEWGPDLGRAGDRVILRVGYRQLTLSNSDVSPQTARGSLQVIAATTDEARLCFTVHGGGTRFTSGDDHGDVLVGGLGISVAARTALGGLLVPFIEARGLAGRSSGQVLDLELDETGLSLGVEGGATARLSRLQIRVTGSFDALSPTLGVTPYPKHAVRVAATLVL